MVTVEFPVGIVGLSKEVIVGTGYDAKPVPLRFTTFMGLAGSFVAMVSVPVLAPACVGLNVTVRTQPPPGCIGEEQPELE